MDYRESRLKRDLVDIISENTIIYDSFYSEIMSAKGIRFFSKSIHKKMEQPFTQVEKVGKILELGAANGEHLPFVKKNYDEYWQTDIRYSPKDRKEILSDHPHFQRNEFPPKLLIAKVDAVNLSRFPDEYFDRVIATCLILHINDIPKALVEWRRVLKSGGTLSIYVHCEPGFLLRLAQKISTKRQFEKRGIDYEVWQYSEHVTYYLRARTFLLKAFDKDLISRTRYPFSFLSWNMSLWEIWHIIKK